ncbi:MAG: sugar phosphate nucleotidyltransferase [Promethearchaeota archaeon]
MTKIFDTAVILAAGKGTRLLPLTKKIPKPLLPVAGKPIIEYSLDFLRELHIKRFIIVVGYKHKQIREYLDEKYSKNHIEYIFQARQLGTANAVNLVKDFVKNDFLVFLGDNLFLDLPPKKIFEQHLTRQVSITLILEEKRTPKETGVVLLGEDNRILKIEEKPSVTFSNIITTGIYIFHPVIFDSIKEVTPSSRGEFEIADAIKKLLKSNNGKVYGTLFRGWRKNVSRAKDLLDANREVLSRIQAREIPITPEFNLIENESQIGGNTKISPPVLIGKDAKIEKNAQIGPYVTIGRNTTVKTNSMIKNSIIFDNTYVPEKIKLDGVIYLNKKIFVQV